MKRIAVIPARGGSKRIPRKNVRPFAGRPMLAYAVDVARAAAVFDHVIVSTDDDEIAGCALAAGAEVPFRRPTELASDVAPTVPVIAHALSACERLGWRVDQACCIYPTVPLLWPDDIRQALALLESSGARFAFPVTPFPAPIERALSRAPDGRTRPLQPAHTLTRTQDLVPAYHDAGQFYWGSAAAWRDADSPHRDAATIVLPAWRAVDIDTLDDWERAEALYFAGRCSPVGGVASPRNCHG